MDNDYADSGDRASFTADLADYWITEARKIGYFDDKHTISDLLFDELCILTARFGKVELTAATVIARERYFDGSPGSLWRAIIKTGGIAWNRSQLRGGACL